MPGVRPMACRVEAQCDSVLIISIDLFHAAAAFEVPGRISPSRPSMSGALFWRMSIRRLRRRCRFGAGTIFLD